MSVFNKESKDDIKIRIIDVKIMDEIMDKWYEVTLRGQVYRAVETYYECECDWSENPDKKEWLLSGVYVFDEDENMMIPGDSYYNIADEVMYYVNQDLFEN